MPISPIHKESDIVIYTQKNFITGMAVKTGNSMTMNVKKGYYHISAIATFEITILVLRSSYILIYL